VSFAEELAEIALSFDGCGAQLQAQRFSNLVAPLGPPDARTMFCARNVAQDANSSCGVVGVGFIRELLRRYGRTDLDLVLTLDWWGIATRLAAAHDALITPGGGRVPGVGCVVRVEAAGRHWFTIIDVGEDGQSLTTIDGGQKDAAGYQLIKKMQRRIPPSGTVELVSGKPVREWIDVEILMRSILAKASPPPVTPVASGPAKGLEGIDVSGHNPKIDWKLAARAGIEFAIVKSSEGVDYEDGMCRAHCAGARSEGLELSTYHYLRVRAGKAQDGARQGEDALRIWERERCTLPPVLDIETALQGSATPLEYLEAIGGWLSVVERATGRPAILYTYPGFWGSKVQFSGALATAYRPLWIADYEPSRSSPIVPAPWGSWQIWQYAGNAGRIGRVDGVTGPVDRNVFRGTRSELRALGRENAKAIGVAA
jgi:lysozyme